MSKLKVCRYNLEWMTSFFGAKRDADWLANQEIPELTLPSKNVSLAER